jgi:hypothetical protein
MEETLISMENSHDVLPMRVFCSRSTDLSHLSNKSALQTLIEDRCHQSLVDEAIGKFNGEMIAEGWELNGPANR